MGSNLLLSVHQFFQELLTTIQSNIQNNTYAAISRGFELATCWNIFNAFAVTLQHEFFGHGYRFRNFGRSIAEPRGYKIRIDMGYTKFDFFDYPYASDAYASSCIAGVESTAVLADQLALRWITQGSIEGRIGGLYREARLDLIRYVMSMDDFPLAMDSGHDINNYALAISFLAHSSQVISPKKLRRYILLNYTDPFLWYSLFAYYQYIYDGCTLDIPMISLGSVCYLPSIRVDVTPFGVITYWNSYLRYHKRACYLYSCYGRNRCYRYFGIGFETPNLISWKNFRLGLRCDIWRQPQLILYSSKVLPILYRDQTIYISEKVKRINTYGGLIVIGGCWKISDIFSLNAQIGSKTMGYVPGRSLDKDFLICFGCSYKI